MRNCFSLEISQQHIVTLDVTESKIEFWLRMDLIYPGHWRYLKNIFYRPGPSILECWYKLLIFMTDFHNFIADDLIVFSELSSEVYLCWRSKEVVRLFDIFLFMTDHDFCGFPFLIYPLFLFISLLISHQFPFSSILLCFLSISRLPSPPLLVSSPQSFPIVTKFRCLPASWTCTGISRHWRAFALVSFFIFLFLVTCARLYWPHSAL